MESWADLQRMEDGGPPAPLAFTGEDMAEWDADDFEAANLAMENDMVSRAAWYDEQAIQADASGDDEEAGRMALEALRLRTKAAER